jgi:hypothetical protein
MTLAATPGRVVAHRPPAVVVLISVLLFLGVTALAGGTAMVFELGGDQVMIPSEWLDSIPIVHSWLIPGLVLGLGFGVGSLLTGYGMLRRVRWGWLVFLERWTGQHWSWIAAIVLGLGHVVWIGLELVYLPEPSLLQVVYGPVGIILLATPFLPQVRRALRVT